MCPSSQRFTFSHGRPELRLLMKESIMLGSRCIARGSFCVHAGLNLLSCQKHHVLRRSPVPEPMVSARHQHPLLSPSLALLWPQRTSFLSLRRSRLDPQVDDLCEGRRGSRGWWSVILCPESILGGSLGIRFSSCSFSVNEAARGCATGSGEETVTLPL